MDAIGKGSLSALPQWTPQSNPPPSDPTKNGAGEFPLISLAVRCQTLYKLAEQEIYLQTVGTGLAVAAEIKERGPIAGSVKRRWPGSRSTSRSICNEENYEQTSCRPAGHSMPADCQQGSGSRGGTVGKGSNQSVQIITIKGPVARVPK